MASTLEIVQAFGGLSQRDKELLYRLLVNVTDASSHYTDATTTKFFPNELSGWVLVGHPNNSLWRTLVRDSVPTSPVISIEPYTTAQAGDHVFPSYAVGPVIHGVYNGDLYRLRVSDADPANPKLRWSKITSSDLQDDDYVFAQGVSWVQRGRSGDHWWMWLVNDSDNLNWKARLLPFNGVVT